MRHGFQFGLPGLGPYSEYQQQGVYLHLRLSIWGSARTVYQVMQSPQLIKIQMNLEKEEAVMKTVK